MNRIKEKWFEIKDKPIVRILFMPVTILIGLVILILSFFNIKKSDEKEE